MKRRATKKSSDTSAGARAIEELAELLRRHDLNEIEVEGEGMRIRLRRDGVAAPTTVHEPLLPAPLATSTETSDGNVSYITSPFVGTFYRSPNPESAPFVDVG